VRSCNKKSRAHKRVVACFGLSGENARALLLAHLLDPFHRSSSASSCLSFFNFIIPHFPLLFSRPVRRKRAALIDWA
jgi:hypothetical protein